MVGFLTGCWIFRGHWQSTHNENENQSPKHYEKEMWRGGSDSIACNVRLHGSVQWVRSDGDLLSGQPHGNGQTRADKWMISLSATSLECALRRTWANEYFSHRGSSDAAARFGDE